MNLLSEWKLTWKPGASQRVLLDFGQEIDAEPDWPLTLGLTVVPLVDSPVPFLRVSGNNSVVFGFRVYSDETLDKTARQRVMESLLTWQTTERAVLKVQINGITDRYWQFASAVVNQHTPTRWMDAGTARVCKRYTITAAGLSQVVP